MIGAGRKQGSICIEIYGSGYVASVKDDIAENLTYFDVKVSGHKTSACGPDVWFSVVVDFLSGVPLDIRSALVALAFNKIINAINTKCCCGKPMTPLVDINMGSYSLKIETEGGEFVDIDEFDLQGILDQANGLALEAYREGRAVSLIRIPSTSIDAPCSSLDVWDIGYQMGDHVAFSVYDSVNKVFLGEQSSE